MYGKGYTRSDERLDQYSPEEALLRCSSQELKLPVHEAEHVVRAEKACSRDRRSMMNIQAS